MVTKTNQNQSLTTFPISCDINIKDHLTIGGLDTIDLVTKYGSPLYIIDKRTFEYNATSYINSLQKYYEDFLVLYAAKSFACLSIFKIANQIGLGIDVVSGGELFAALKANVNKKNIYFHGNNKSKEELEMSITNNIGKIVCDNFYELEVLYEIAKKHNKQIEILIRLTPGIECHTHEYIKTGHLDSKFGFDLEYLDEVMDLLSKYKSNLILKGLHSHIGSQIFELKPYSDSAEILLDKVSYIKNKFGLELTEINIGGGIGIAYTKNDDPISLDDWARTTTDTIKNKCKTLNLQLPKIVCEPGRSLIGPSGITLYKVGSNKQVPDGKKYIAIDGGMADNPRPITYQAKYTALVANKANYENEETVTIAGRYCETGDLLIKDIELPTVETGDIIAVSNTGAYNYSMSSNYNMVPKPACILVNEKKSEVIIERENYNDLIAKQRLIG